MTLTLILAVVAIIIVALIIATVVQQKHRQAEQEKRAEISRLTLTLDETEDLLSRIASIPITKSLMIILHNRIMETQKLIWQLTTDVRLESQISDRQVLIEQIAKTFHSQGLDTFRLPNDDREVLQIVQVLKKIKTTIISEHKRGRVNPDVYSNEVKRVDLLQIRVNIHSIIKRAKIAVDTQQIGSAKTYLEKAIKTLNAINSEGDHFVREQLDHASQMLNKINQIDQSRKKDAQLADAKNEKASTDIDVLFEPKKKW